jgi:hypothetical protein
MSQQKVSTDWNGDGCYDGLKLTDVNDLFELQMGQNAMDFSPDNIYYVPAPCGTKCNDDNGKPWTNCKGYDDNTINQVTKKNQGFIIAFIIVAIGFFAYWYFTKK